MTPSMVRASQARGRGWFPARLLGVVGDWVSAPLGGLWRLLGLGAAVVVQGLRPGAWRRTVRDELVRHCHEVGVDALPAVIVVGALVGLSLASLALYWLGQFGQSDVVGPFLVLVLVREVGPLTVGLLVIGRSASVYVAELNALRASGKIATLDAMGIDPFHLLVMPRVVAMSASCFCLTVVLTASALTMGYVGASIARLTSLSYVDFLREVLDSMGLAEFVLIVVKPLLIGFVVALIACSVSLLPAAPGDGLRVLLARSFVAALTATLLVSGLLSALL